MLRHEEVSSLLGGTPSPKRTRNERQGVHNWHPYYAGYSEGFVRGALSVLTTSAPNNVVVLDPWNGSGVTTLVAQQMGFSSIGIDINPVMVTFAGAKVNRVLQQADNVIAVAARIAEQAKARWSTTIVDADLVGWVSESIAMELVAIRNAILENTTWFVDKGNLWVGTTSVDGTPPQGDVFCLLTAALFRTLRTVGSIGSGSNPTWVVRTDDMGKFFPGQIGTVFQGYVRHMLMDLSLAFAGNPVPAEVTLRQGDARGLRIADEAIDVVVTSPPYCTRIDYAVSTKPELLLLGLGERDGFDVLRRNTMGAPIIKSCSITPQRTWGQTCLDVLQAVRCHNSKAAATYYYPNLLQYFEDAEESLRELMRVLKVGGLAAIVVQSSYFKDIEIPLGQIYVEMLRSLGGLASVARRETVRSHMAHVNRKSAEYVPQKVYYEDVVLLQKT